MELSKNIEQPFDMNQQTYGHTLLLNGYAYINIPKNASCFVKTLFPEAVTRVSLLKDIDKSLINKYVVVLRNPLERWISGISQTKVGEDDEYFNKTLDDAFTQIVVDDHTTPQYKFIEDIDYDNTIWFYVTNDQQEFKSTMLRWAIDTLNVEPHDFTNDPGNFYNIAEGRQLKIKQLFVRLMEEQPELKQRIIDFYKEDYDLINKVIFYNINPLDRKLGLTCLK